MLLVYVLDGQGRRPVYVEGERIAIGRDPACDLFLPGDPTVSRVHAVLELRAHEWFVVDEQSRNGLLLNGSRVDGSQRLSPGDRLMIGQYVVVLPEESLGALAETAPAEDAADGQLRQRTGLSPREIEVLRLVCSGRTDQEIAAEMYLSVRTIHSHLERIRAKTDQRRRPDLVRWAMSQGLA